jgi:2-keto-3-deoxy-L-rhamnonate aldolase RhmA
MARPNLLRQKLEAGRTCTGPLFQEFWSPELVEFCGHAGFDYVVLDGEHAAIDPQMARHLIRAAQVVGVTALVRVPRPDAGLILQYLDAGAEGLILAHCNTSGDAEALVSACKYPPRGVRGAANPIRARDARNPQGAREHIEIADREVMCLGLIEEPRAVQNLPAMLGVEGFDGCFIGPGDLSLTMGRAYFGGVAVHPEVEAVVEGATHAILAAAKIVMRGAATPAEARALSQRGVRMISVDIGLLLRQASDQFLGAFRDART